MQNNSKVWLLPISCFVTLQFTFIGTYMASIIQNHVVPNVPYISDAATYSPESCIFGQLINTGSVLLALTVYTRYKQMSHLTENYEVLKGAIGKLNRNSLFIGLASCYGISIVANFQETNVLIMHYIGAYTCFGMGTIYLWLQSIISYKIEPYIHLRKANCRMIMTIICSIFFVMVSLCGAIAHFLFEGTDRRHWYPSDGGWGFHVTATVSEWIVATFFSCFILTFTDEFKFIKFESPKIIFIEIEQDESVLFGLSGDSDT